jgi:penicillin V acylase-like amidase (Ntn superfamily)
MTATACVARGTDILPAVSLAQDRTLAAFVGGFLAKGSRARRRYAADMLSLRLGLLAALILAASARACACTTFCLRSSEHLVYGRNFDYYSVLGRVVVNRRGIQKTTFDTTPAFSWVSRFGSLTFSQFGVEFPNGGMNEAGLVIEHMWLDGTQYPGDARPPLPELQWVQYQLDCAATVAEVVASDQRVRIATGSSPIHFLVADRGGNCATIEFLRGQMVVHTGESLPVAALANHTYAESLAYAATVPPMEASHTSSLGRFVHAADAVRNFPPTAEVDAVAYAFDTLADVAQPNWTRWSIVYDLGNLVVHFRTQWAPAIKQVRLDRLDFRPSAPMRTLDINVFSGGEVVPSAVYSTTDNFLILTLVYRETTPISWVSSAYLQRRAACPEANFPAALPQIYTQPASIVAAPGAAVELSVSVSPGAAVQWLRNGRAIAGANSTTLRLAALEPAQAGVYTATATNAAGAVGSEPAVVGLVIDAKVRGDAREYAANIEHVASGNTYDQFLLTGSAASITADRGQIARISFIDLSDDIVQVEFSGDGTLTLLLDDASGPELPQKYDQDVRYLRGHATVVLSNASANTHVAIFSVGSLTNPAVVRAGERYDAHADLAALAVQSADGKLAAMRCGNAAFSGAAGAVGIFAPGIAIEPGPVNVHNICAADSATSYLAFGAATRVCVTGGDLWQANGAAVRCSGISAQGLALAAGTSSAGTWEPCSPLRGRCECDGADASASLVIREPAF